MKRELKDCGAAHIGLGEARVTRHIPMKRELKGSSNALKSASRGTCHKAYPDEKGTESAEESPDQEEMMVVTRHIPMKRELKVQRSNVEFTRQRGHKAYPDEKGTERAPPESETTQPVPSSQGISR